MYRRTCWWVTDIARVFQKRDVDVTGPGARLVAPCLHSALATN